MLQTAMLFALCSLCNPAEPNWTLLCSLVYFSSLHRRQTLFRQTLFWQMLFRLKFTSTDASLRYSDVKRLHFTFTFTRGQQFHV